MRGSRDPLLKFWWPPNISRMVEARNIKFSTETDGSEFKRKKCKIGQKRSCGDHVTHFWNFGDPLISREWLKLEISNMAWRRMAVPSNERNAKLRQRGVIWGSRDPLLEFRDPLISREWLKLETSNLARRRTSVSSNEKNAKLGQKGSCGVTWPTFKISRTP